MNGLNGFLPGEILFIAGTAEWYYQSLTGYYELLMG